MIEELKEEQLIEKTGGRFKLSALIQKRLVYLNKDAPAYVETGQSDETKSPNNLEVVIQEIMQDKIYLDIEGNLCGRDNNGNDLGPLEPAVGDMD